MAPPELLSIIERKMILHLSSRPPSASYACRRAVFQMSSFTSDHDAFSIGMLPAPRQTRRSFAAPVQLVRAIDLHLSLPPLAALRVRFAARFDAFARRAASSYHHISAVMYIEIISLRQKDNAHHHLSFSRPPLLPPALPYSSLKRSRREIEDAERFAFPFRDEV